ncbi:MAG: UbiA family prenyltransferase [Bacteroidales bacterium]
MVSGKINIVRLFRLREWLLTKLCFQLAFALILVYYFDRGYLEFIEISGIFLLYLLPAGAFAYLINDYCDRGVDFLAGKMNACQKLRPEFALLLIVFSGAAAFSPLLLLDEYPSYYLGLIVAQYAMIIAYSAPSIRLKTTYAGIFADALFSFLFPALIVVLISLDVMSRHFQMTISGYVFILWLILAGLRSIISHQLSDFVNDKKALQKTLAVRTGKAVAEKIRHAVLFCELIAMLVFFALLPEELYWWPVAAAGMFVLSMLLAGRKFACSDIDGFLESLNHGLNFHLLNGAAILLLCDNQLLFGLIPLAYLFLRFHAKFTAYVSVAGKWIYYKWQGLIRRLH